MKIILGLLCILALCLVLAVLLTLFAFAIIELDNAITKYIREQK